MVRNENGFTLIELLGVITILGSVSILLMGIIFSISKTSAIQGELVEFQNTSNQMVSKIENISQTKGLYEKAGYIGKFVGTDWKDQQIIKSMKKEEADPDYIPITKFDQGAKEIYLTDITDESNKKSDRYSVQKKKIKLLQHKNENESIKTQEELPNFRDTFSIQTSYLIIFYEGDITFNDYYEDTSGIWDFERIKKLSNVKYFREFETVYRDDEKSRGGVPGNGRW